MLKKSISKTKRFMVWLEQASYDLEAAEVSKNSAFYEWACFQAEQSAEKALKAVLVHAGWRPPKMHKLAVLMSYCNNANEEFRKTKFEFRDLEAFTFVSRYPFLVPGENLSPHKFIRLSDAEKCINQAKAFLQKIKALLNV
ncbi:MAG: HEPN domain-containing protein [Candidatus Dojkabacteria bacterium]|nr:HEPN domain-containing protein [Candidatus Dojkabacteria bacterium]